MQGQCQSRRAIALALAAILCLDLVVVSAAAPNKKAVPRSSAAELSAEETRRAEAMAHYAAAFSLRLTDGMDAALPEYLRAFELDPKHTTLAILLAQYYAGNRDYAKAVSVLETASKASPTSPEPWLGIGAVQRTADQTLKAIAAFKQALKLDPLNQTAMRQLLDIYLEQDSVPATIDLLDRAWKQQSKQASYWLGLGEIYAAVLKQKPSLAKNIDRNRIRLCYEKALALAPADPDVLFRLADAYVNAGDLERAADMYSRLLVVRPDLPRVREQLVLMYKAAGERQKAVSILEEIIRRDPLRFEAYNMLGELYDDLNQQEKAVANYEQSLTLNPNQPEVYVRLSVLQLRLKKPEDALKTLAQARQKFPTKYQMPYLLGLVHSDLKDYAQAVTAFTEAEQLASDAPDEPQPTTAFYFAYGSACERSGDFDKATALFRKALELDPDNHQALNYLGYMWADKGINLDEALQMIEKAVQHEPDSGAYVDSLGWVLYKLGRHEEALTHLQRASDLIKDDAVVFDHLGEVLMKLGRRDEALAQWRKAHDLEPDNKGIAEKLQKYSTNHTATH